MGEIGHTGHKVSESNIKFVKSKSFRKQRIKQNGFHVLFRALNIKILGPVVITLKLVEKETKYLIA